MYNLSAIKFQGGRALAVAAIALLLAVWVGPGLTLAHAQLTSSTPAGGSTVAAGLTQIVLNFSEEISLDQSTGELQGGNGSGIPGVQAVVDRVDRKKMVLTTPALGAGTWTVKWKSVTEDDNGIENGSFTFTVADNTPAPTPTPGATATGGQGGTGTTSGSLPVSGVRGSPVLPVAITLLALGLLASGAIIIRRAVRQV